MKDLLVKELIIRQKIADLIFGVLKNEEDKEALTAMKEKPSALNILLVNTQN